MPDKGTGEMLSEVIDEYINLFTSVLSKYIPEYKKVFTYIFLIIWLLGAKYLYINVYDQYSFQFGIFYPKSDTEKGIIIDKEVSYEYEEKVYYLYEFALTDNTIDQKWISFSSNGNLKPGTYVNVETDVLSSSKKRIEKMRYNIPVESLIQLSLIILILVLLPVISYCEL